MGDPRELSGTTQHPSQLAPSSTAAHHSWPGEVQKEPIPLWGFFWNCFFPIFLLIHRFRGIRPAPHPSLEEARRERPVPRGTVGWREGLCAHFLPSNGSVGLHGSPPSEFKVGFWPPLGSDGGAVRAAWETQGRTAESVTGSRVIAPRHFSSATSLPSL